MRGNPSRDLRLQFAGQPSSLDAAHRSLLDLHRDYAASGDERNLQALTP